MSILNAPTRMMKDLGYNAGYQYDHDHPDAFSGQPFLPDQIEGTAAGRLYAPEERGFEREVKKRMDWWAGLRAKRRGGS